VNHAHGGRLRRGYLRYQLASGHSGTRMVATVVVGAVRQALTTASRIGAMLLKGGLTHKTFSARRCTFSYAGRDREHHSVQPGRALLPDSVAQQSTCAGGLLKRWNSVNTRS